MTTPTKYIAYKMSTCGRCAGVGRYSYNQTDGDMCYGCKGKGKVEAKGVKASKEKIREFIRSLPKPVSDADRNRALEFAATLPGILIEE